MCIRDRTKGIENSADTDTKITKFGISFNSDGTTTSVSYTHLDHFNELDEDNRRLVVRGDIKQLSLIHI